jgi:ElaB/YqjD/DUF883 family membrane-anchored ribosome-binding protein
MFKSSSDDQMVNKNADAMSSTHNAASQAIESIGKAVEQGIGRVRETSDHVRISAARASEGTVNYIRHDPVKSVLMAAATGAALMALVGLLTRHNNRH